MDIYINVNVGVVSEALGSDEKASDLVKKMTAEAVSYGEVPPFDTQLEIVLMGDNGDIFYGADGKPVVRFVKL